ncbi:hypothetical protein SDC9_192412 [bioreactor metagenome]|uniref:Uncharacterized protein n=1 Tax=bioreactor metagenome TaxID=1076179 RepID=A0A645I0P0_9ZZZZ
MAQIVHRVEIKIDDSLPGAIRIICKIREIAGTRVVYQYVDLAISDHTALNHAIDIFRFGQIAFQKLDSSSFAFN